MKVVLYMAVTGNGYIAKENDDTSWISKEEWNSYSAIVRRTGNLVIGHRTYDIITKQPEFSEFEKVKIIIVSHNDFDTLSLNHVAVKTPEEALSLLKDFKEVIVAGGSNLNSSFVEKGLIDEIYLDIEPIIFGKGIKLFTGDNFEAKLKLLETRKLTEDIIQLHYKVLK
ncbi:dihydrofolate reductase [Candidatus Microgenomates bacterium]|nr:dihydrofolate reductase [Candidatus Microgenomates bacterium]